MSEKDWKLYDTENENLMHSIHWGENVDQKKAVKLRDFISKVGNKRHWLQEGDFMFLFFEGTKDFRKRFGNNMKVSVLGSRPGLYIYQIKKTTRGGLKIGEAERLHERMQKHTRPSDGDSIEEEYNHGVVILKCNRTRKSDEFNAHEVRKLCEIMVNDFLYSSGRKYDTVLRPRVYVSKGGCEQAKELIEALQETIRKSRRLRNIVRKGERGKKVILGDIFFRGGV